MSPKLKLEGHTSPVIEVAWSPHTQGRLVSCSYDFTAIVWDVRGGGSPLCSFSGHQGRVMCCLWHPVREELVITG